MYNQTQVTTDTATYNTFDTLQKNGTDWHMAWNGVCALCTNCNLANMRHIASERIKSIIIKKGERETRTQNERNKRKCRSAELKKTSRAAT